MEEEALLTISEAARRLGLNASALRYYEQRGLVSPTVRRSGCRLYGPQELRRLAFIQMAQRTGATLDDIAALLHEPREVWRTVVSHQITVLDRRIREATAAKEHLRHALDCPSEHPVAECPYLLGALDQWLAAAEVNGSPHSLADDVPTARRSLRRSQRKV